MTRSFSDQGIDFMSQLMQDLIELNYSTPNMCYFFLISFKQMERSPKVKALTKTLY